MSYEDVLIREAVGHGNPDSLEPEPVDPNESTETDSDEWRIATWPGGHKCEKHYINGQYVDEWRTPAGRIFRDCDTVSGSRDASHLSQSATDTAKPLTLDKVESFTQWLDQQGDSLAPADSFTEWLKEREDSI